MRWGLGFVLVMSLAKLFVADQAVRGLMRFSTLACFAAAMGLKYLLELSGGLRCAAKRRSDGAPLLAWLAETQPPELRAWYRLHRAHGAAFWAWICRRGGASVPVAGQGVGYLRRSAYPTVVALVLLGACIEMPVLYMLVGAQELPHSTVVVLHTAIIVATGAVLAWVLGDRHLLGAGRHVVTATDLHLLLGARCFGRVPLTAIVDCRSLGRRQAVRMDAEASGVLVVSPCDRPNVELTLAEPNDVVVTHLQRPRAGLRKLLIYVDEPSGLARALRSGELER
jgi:hypothetical protein